MNKEAVFSNLKQYVQLTKRVVKSLEWDECYSFKLIVGGKAVFNSKIMPLLAESSVERVCFIDECDGFMYLGGVKQVMLNVNPIWKPSQD